MNAGFADGRAKEEGDGTMPRKQDVSAGSKHMRRKATGRKLNGKGSIPRRGTLRAVDDPIEVPARIVRRVPAFWIYGLLMVLAVYTAVTCIKQETDMQNLRRATAEILAKIEVQQRKNEQLQEQKVEIASGDSAELLAREKLGYVKDGERIFVDSNK